ncbi:EEF1AKMT1 [Symbiodinium sp. KB8]|nr:EEF1AKMT1 [Symbiodinium sp. KB8]
MAASDLEFLKVTGEREDLNQYWYSAASIQAVVGAVAQLDCRTAFLSTPSIYFCLPKELRAKCMVFDFDKQWKDDPGFVFYDFNDPTEFPEELLHTFDAVVIDPPFITREVWEKYTATAKALLREDPTVPVDEAEGEEGKDGGEEEQLSARGNLVIATTIHENAEFMGELLGVQPTAWQPSIPNLVYQYDLYANFPSERFAEKNPEIPSWDD